MTADSLASALQEGMQELQLPIDEAQQQALLSYLDLLQRWNKAYNLTAVRDPRAMVHKHLLDSLAISALLPDQARHFLDVGTGGGLPGVPLSIMHPDRQFDLLDSNGKKTRFLFQVKTALGLDNMAVHHSRAESWNPEQAYDVVLSRAFASLLDMVTSCKHLCRDGGYFLAMKGQMPERELAELPPWVEPGVIHQLVVPGLDEERHLVVLHKPVPKTGLA